ncbi:MAG: glycosyltransferase [Cyanobacteria bacterium SIG29]|nr:glycosyltransferase [Cyanobacteria bacterium SIG29]
MKFSVLMSIYVKENPQWFKIALESILNQTLLPNEIVLVEDGPLTSDLYSIIDNYVKSNPNLFKIVKLEKNSGLGEALRNGVLNCSYDYIARMDTDDIARNDRFQKQIEFLKINPDVDLVGSWISEFEENPENIISYRQLPIIQDEIYKFAQFRCPVNHMTVMYKKEAVLKAGNYQTFKNIEDYYLWGRMLKNGAKFANIPECLVNVRAGNAMFKRRANLTYFFNSEFPLHTELYKMKFINLKQYLRNICSKFLLRILPTKIMGIVYKKFLRKDNT